MERRLRRRPPVPGEPLGSGASEDNKIIIVGVRHRGQTLWSYDDHHRDEDGMVVSATSPDQNIRAEVTNDTDVRVTFRPGSYNLYDEERLAHQLARLGVSA